MNSVFCITIRFLDPVPQFHGRGSDGEPEWPPSPLRLFQALVAAAATRWREKLFDEYARPALRWLETVQASVVTPAIAIERFGYRTYVPNNSADLMTAAWARGDTETTMAKFRTEKDVRPTHLTGEAVHYLYPVIDSEFEKHREALITAARCITHLGWGVDMVAGNAAVLTQEEADALTGERWLPCDGNSGTRLRVPREGTLQALMDKHSAFLGRLSHNGFAPVPPLTVFNTLNYRRATDPIARPWVAFRINSVDPDERSPAFDTARRCRDVAAWVRHIVGEVCQGWPYDDIASFVHGHDPSDNSKPLKGELADQRFMYIPLPSIERRGQLGEKVGSIRRVLITAPLGCERQIEWIRQRLPGQELVAFRGEGHEVVGMLQDLPRSDWVLRKYTESARVWSTVTPVILPGYDEAAPHIVARRVQAAMEAGKGAEAIQRVHEQAEERTRNLFRTAFVQAGFSVQLLDSPGFELQWRKVGFRAGVDLVNQYQLPDSLKGFPAYHVCVRFPSAIGGPLMLGAGRYRGFGTFVSESG